MTNFMHCIHILDVANGMLDVSFECSNGKILVQVRKKLLKVLMFNISFSRSVLKLAYF